MPRPVLLGHEVDPYDPQPGESWSDASETTTFHVDPARALEKPNAVVTTARVYINDDGELKLRIDPDEEHDHHDVYREVFVFRDTDVVLTTRLLVRDDLYETAAKAAIKAARDHTEITGDPLADPTLTVIRGTAARAFINTIRDYLRDYLD